MVRSSKIGTVLELELIYEQVFKEHKSSFQRKDTKSALVEHATVFPR